jgi:16S rRNA (cytidine1402-2'-O)-methyltransferase
MSDAAGKLYLVPTPIGNMGDITKRAQETLAQADIIACEDTRHSGSLLKKLGIKARLISYHEFNEAQRAEQLIGEIKQGSLVAVISDAGSPGISDPAYRVVRAAIEAGLEIEALPGPTSIIPALTASGLPTDRFHFEGFLPVKSGGRKKRLEVLKERHCTLIFFESPHRILKTLAAATEILGERPACLAREISKLHEQFLRGTLGEIQAELEKRTVKGELVLVIAGLSRRRSAT